MAVYIIEYAFDLIIYNKMTFHDVVKLSTFQMYDNISLLGQKKDFRV